MPPGWERTAYSVQKADEARVCKQQLTVSGEISDVPGGVAAAVPHTMYAAAVELLNGRVLPVVVRGAALYMVQKGSAATS